MNHSLAFPSGVEGICNRFYGEFSKSDARDCSRAINLFETGSDKVTYTVNRGSGDHALPFNRESGSCMIQVEMAGSNVPQTFDIAPDEIRSLLNIVFDQCVKGEHGVDGKVGGFVTTETTTLKEWLTSPEFGFEKPYPHSTAYLTVSISHPVPDWLSAGSYDPIMAFVLSDTALKASDGASKKSSTYRQLIQRSERLYNQGMRMEPRGQRIAWWQVPPMPPDLVALRDSATTHQLPGAENTTSGDTATAKRRKRFA